MFLGFISVIRSIPIFAYFQTYVSEDIRGKFFAALNTFNSLLSLISIWLYGILLDKMLWYAVLIAAAVFSSIVIGVLQIWEYKNKTFANVKIYENKYEPVPAETEN